MRRVALLQGPAPLPREAFETVQVHGVRRGGEPVAALNGLDGAPAQGPPCPPDQGLEGAGRVRGRVAVPHLVDEDAGRDGPAGAQREHGEQGAQPRPTEGDGRAVVAECPGGTEDAVAHGPIVRDGGGAALTGWNSTSGLRRSSPVGPYDPLSRIPLPLPASLLARPLSPGRAPRRTIPHPPHPLTPGAECR